MYSNNAEKQFAYRQRKRRPSGFRNVAVENIEGGTMDDAAFSLLTPEQQQQFLKELQREQENRDDH